MKNRVNRYKQGRTSLNTQQAVPAILGVLFLFGCIKLGLIGKKLVNPRKVKKTRDILG